MKEKVSVIIPCYNVELYIDRCLNSVVNQTIGLDKLEIICVNDASTDGTWEKLCSWEKKYSENIILINCTENGAQGRARNIALSHASGAYITFLDSDDWVEVDTYERMYQAMERYDCDIVKCGWTADLGRGDIWENQKKRFGNDYMLNIDSIEERRKFLATGLMGDMCVDKMYRASIIFDHQLAFPEQCKYEDIYWGILSYFYVDRIYFMEEIMYHYYRNSDSTTMTRDAAYHMDRLSVVMYLWEECERRGLLEYYYTEMELNFLIYYYLGGIKMLILRYTDLKYDVFQEICQTVQKIIPHYKENPYIKQILSDMDQLQIALIDQNISREEFEQVINLLSRDALEKK